MQRLAKFRRRAFMTRDKGLLGENKVSDSNFQRTV